VSPDHRRPAHRAPRPRPDVLLVALGACAALLLVAGIGTAAWLVATDGTRPDPPDAWDPRVEELVAFVEAERGLTFDHPVEVEFLPDEDFREQVTARPAGDDTEQAEIESFVSLLRAVGLVSGDVDLVAVGEELLGEGVVGFYRFDDERIVVRGAELDDERRATVVHELTHALQDQHFGIGAREHGTSGEAAAFRAVVEADALQVEQAWIEALPATARQDLEQAREALANGTTLDGVPEVLVELAGFPYVFGPDFLGLVLEERGPEARDRLFTDPPSTQQHIVRPRTYLDGRLPEALPAPELMDGEEEVLGSAGDFGMLSLLVVLAERIEFERAWSAVEGWAGDATVAFVLDGRTCIRTDVVFDGDAHAEAFAAAFEQWAQETPARHSRSGRQVRWESCDPGPETDQERPEGHVSGIQGLTLLRGLEIGFEESGVPPEVATCTAEGVIDELGANRIAELEPTPAGQLDDADITEIQASVFEVMARCA
jgi:hypothetical protein